MWVSYFGIKDESLKNKNMKATSMNRKHSAVYFFVKMVIYSWEFMKVVTSFSYQMFQCLSDPQFLAYITFLIFFPDLLGA